MALPGLFCLPLYANRSGDMASAMRGSAVGFVSAWHADGREFDPHIWQYFFKETDHEIISTAIFSLPLLQDGTGESSGKLPRRLAQEQCG